MVSPLSSSGVGSGTLDVSAIVTALMQIERKPVEKLDAREKAQNAKISGYGSIKSLFATFQSAAAALGSSSGSKFSARKATSSDISKISAIASSTAATGIYAVKVSKLAQSQNLVAAGQTSKTAPISDGTATYLTFDFGTITLNTAPTPGTLIDGIYTNATFTSNGTTIPPISIDGTNNSLEGIRNAINGANIGVTASIINDGSAAPYRLVISSNNPGVANSLKITTSGGDGTIASLLAYDPEATQNLTQTAAAQDAAFNVNGIDVTKTSNQVSDAIDGVTLNLLSEATSPVSVAITRESSDVVDAATAFVDAYNALVTGIRNAVKFKSGSALEGDVTLRSMLLDLRNVAVNPVAGGNVSRLDEVGITFTSDGKMQLESSKLTAALATDFNDVANLFNSAGGFATQYETLSASAINTGGSIPLRISAVQGELTRISDERVTLESRLKVIETRYRTQFSNLNVLLASISQTSNFLTQLQNNRSQN